MSFTRKQQGHFRPLVEQAWQATCKDASDKAAKHAWYEQELTAATGKASTSACDHGRDFELAMAHFEILSGGNIYWQLRAHGGDYRRIIHEIHDYCRDFECDENYMRGIARHELGLTASDPLPELESLTKDQLIVILRAIKIEIRREIMRGDTPHVPVRSETVDEPF